MQFKVVNLQNVLDYLKFAVQKMEISGIKKKKGFHNYKNHGQNLEEL